MNAEEPAWVDVVRQRAEGLRFGTIQIVIHEGRVTQIEATEKTRFPLEAETARRPPEDHREPSAHRGTGPRA